MQLESEKVQIINGINKWFLRTIAKKKKKKKEEEDRKSNITSHSAWWKSGLEG